jgi:exosortase
MGNLDQISVRQSSGRLIGPVDLLWAAALVLAAVFVIFDAWRDTLRIALSDEECSYVLLAPVVIGWLAWVRRDALSRCAVRRQWAGLAMLAAGWLIWWHGYLTDPVIWRAGAVVVAVGAFVAAIGFDASLKLAPALAACVFLIPVDPTGRYHVAEPLETATAFAAQRTCDLLGMYVDRSGNLLSINGVDVTIAEACNGIRMVMTLFMVCYVVAFTLPLKWWVRLLLLAASPLVAIVSNVVRLVPTVWMFGHVSNAAAERFHDLSGWVMTIVAFVVLMGLARLLQGATESERAALAGPKPEVAGPARELFV